MKQVFIKESLGYLIILFLFSPILALVYALKNFSNRQFHIILLLFAFLYGYTFLIVEGSDSERYIDYFNIVSQFTWSEFIEQIIDIYSPSARFNDVYMISLMYLCSLFSLSFEFFLGLQSLIYFYLLLSIVNVVTNNSSNIKYRRYIVFLFGCVFIYSFASGIVGIRFQTAYLFFCLFSIKYIFTNKSKYIIFAGFSCFIHISLIPMYLGLLLFYGLTFVKNSKLKLLIVLSFIVVLNSFNIFELSQGVDSEVIASKVDGYTSDEYVEEREEHVENWNWYIQVKQYATFYFLIIALFLTKLKVFKLKSNNVIDNFFLLSIILLVISVFSETFLDSITNRYRFFFQFMGLLYLFFILSYNRNTWLSKTLKHTYFLIFILNVLVGLRADSYTFDVIRLSISPLFTILGFEGANIYNII